MSNVLELVVLSPKNQIEFSFSVMFMESNVDMQFFSWISIHRMYISDTQSFAKILKQSHFKFIKQIFCAFEDRSFLNEESFEQKVILSAKFHLLISVQLKWVKLINGFSNNFHSYIKRLQINDPHFCRIDTIHLFFFVKVTANWKRRCTLNVVMCCWPAPWHWATWPPYPSESARLSKWKFVALTLTLLYDCRHYLTVALLQPPTRKRIGSACAMKTTHNADNSAEVD